MSAIAGCGHELISGHTFIGFPFVPGEDLSNECGRVATCVNISEHQLQTRRQSERRHLIVPAIAIQLVKAFSMRIVYLDPVGSSAFSSATASTFSSMIGFRISGLKRWYRWLPHIAADTSNPLPTFPCAKQCTYCATLWIRVRPTSVSSEAALKCKNKAVTSDVVIAAELPRPVLCTFPSVVSSFENGSTD